MVEGTTHKRFQACRKDSRWQRQSDALSLARLYGVLAQGGGDIISPDGLKAATVERYNGPDVAMGLPTRFGAGYCLGGPESMLGWGEDAVERHKRLIRAIYGSL